MVDLQDGETPPRTHKKMHRVRRPKIDENLAERCTHPDSRVPVVNNDGQILTGDDAPLLRELDIWLEEHPTFTPLSEVCIDSQIVDIDMLLCWASLHTDCLTCRTCYFINQPPRNKSNTISNLFI